MAHTLIGPQASVLSDRQRIAKRIFDVSLAFVSTIAASPLMAVAGALILLEDGRPVLFRQERVGELGRRFVMYKLRTMKVDPVSRPSRSDHRNEVGTASVKQRNDPRVTHTGRFLRRFSIDELPQLLNVLRGEMSLVGPRPELPEWVDQYEPWQQQRLTVPAGITGWWQITGRSDKVMHLHTEDDLYYVRNYSFWLDLNILLRTLWVVLLGRGAF